MKNVTRNSTQRTSAHDKIVVDFDESRVDGLFSDINRCDGPGAAVGVAIGGMPVYRKGFGLANVELPVTLSPTIRMRIASVAKHFTCLAYMLLCEKGRASLDDPIGKYIPEIHPVGSRATLRQLMGHTSGLRDVHDISYLFSSNSRQVSGADLLSLYQRLDDVNAVPGTSWNYNNGGYLLLTVAIERIADKELETVLRESIFEPAGMHDTVLRRFDSGMVANCAATHISISPTRFERHELGVDAGGAGGVVTTVNDMLQWLAQMDLPVVGTSETWNLMRTPHVLANGASTGYGLGLMTSRYRGVEVLSHSGGVPGCGAQMLKVPAAGLDVMIMVNRQDVSAELLANKVLDVCLPNLGPMEHPPSHPFARGTFRSATTGRVIQLCSADVSHSRTAHKHQMASIDGTEIPLEQDRDGVFRTLPGPFGHMKLEIEVVEDPSEQAAIRFRDFGNLDELAPVPMEREWKPEGILGRYRSETTCTEASFRQCESGPRLTTYGKFGSSEYALEYLGGAIWGARATGPLPWSGTLSFNREKTAFYFSTLRTRMLPFRRI